jgi:predicted RecA/RadA family phage recombinase
MANSTPVTIASDQTAVLTTPGGNVASAAADSGNPVKVGTKYNSSLSSFTSGNRADLQSNLFGELAIRHRNKFTNTTGAATTTIKSGAGVFAGICLNNGTASSTITIYDNTAGSGTKIASIAPGSVALFGTCTYWDAEFATGLTIVTTVASTDVTILYQ